VKQQIKYITTLVFPICLFLLTTCTGNLNKNIPKQAPSKKCVPYFQFDAVLHYKIGISDDSVSQLLEKSDRTQEENEILNILSDEVLDDKFAMRNLSDTIKLAHLNNIGFGLREISRDKFAAINSLFCEKHYNEVEGNMCIPVYRDILVFKKHNNTVGFARICFDCEMSNIVGSNGDTHAFGQGGGFTVLAQLLN
jgi:hypothetical protein